MKSDEERSAQSESFVRHEGDLTEMYSETICDRPFLQGREELQHLAGRGLEREGGGLWPVESRADQFKSALVFDVRQGNARWAPQLSLFLFAQRVPCRHIVFLRVDPTGKE